MRLPLFIAGVCFWLAGCSPSAETPEVKPSADQPGKAEVKAEEPAKKDGAKKDAPPAPKAPTFLEAVKDKAVLLDPVEGECRPPDLTVAGKNVGKIFEAIVGTETKKGLWDEIRFTTPEGKKVRYTAHVKTDLGTIQIELLPEAAPNHVRNFIALARAGYYDGLCFHRTLQSKFANQPWHLIEAGCPKGTGEIGYGSVGYWLKEEIVSDLKHDEGVVGAWYTSDINSAACKFYINLTPSPWMDEQYTIFGKIVGGLDVARTINSRPVHPPTRAGEVTDRPVNPVVIREVTIASRIE